MEINFYHLDVIPIILKKFEVNNLVISGSLDKNVLDQILDYSTSDGVMCNIHKIKKCTDDNDIFKELSNFKDYDAILLNDDSNWYTVFQELSIIRKNNSSFPLVFVCNNKFPNKRRDAYSNPAKIPSEFINEYSEELNYGNLIFFDEFFHAVEENTPKNGVLTAIEDFLSENDNIKMLNINFLNGISLLCDANFYNDINLIFDDFEQNKLTSDEINYILSNYQIYQYINYLSNFTNKTVSNNYFKEKLDDKNKIIEEYDRKIKLMDVELKYKNAKLDNIYSKLNLNDSKIINLQSCLENNEKIISSLQDDVNSLNDELVMKNKMLSDNNDNLKLKDNQIKLKDKELKLLNFKYSQLLSLIDDKEYYINSYKTELSNNSHEINYLRKSSFIKKLLNPLSYVLLLFKSSPKEFFLNYKLYRLLKNSSYFDIGFYLNDNDIQNSKWCKYFSPELHYVCCGFNENRKFNKMYFNTHSKRELVDYIMNCQKER